MPLALKIVLIVLAVVLVLFIVLIIVGRKMQKKQEASQADIEAASQILSMLVIDKKRMKITEANLPKVVTEQIPKYMKLAKMPIVKAKIGPKVMTLIADVKVFDALPVKMESKVKVSGIYITEIISTRGKVTVQPKKKGFRAKLAEKAAKAQAEALVTRDPAEPYFNAVSPLAVDELNAGRLGTLMALYEHKTTMLGTLFGINPFDQPGVELGKKLSRSAEADIL